MIGRFAALLALGAVLFVARGLVLPAERFVVVVEPGDDVDAAILIDQAIRGRWYATDSVIRGQLVRAMQFAGEEGTDAELVDRGVELGLVQTDPLIRARLLERARWALGAVPEPSNAQLEAWLAAHPEDFWVDAVYRIRQVPDPPVPGLLPTMSGTEEQLAVWIGEDAAAEIATLKAGDRRGIRSAWATHDVLVENVSPERPALLHEVEHGVREAWKADRRDRIVGHRLALLRERYEVVER